MRRVWIFLWLTLALAGTAHADACRLNWQSIRSYTDGTAVPGAVMYHVWYQPLVASPPPVEVVTTTGDVTIVLPDCKPGKYFVSAFQERPGILESKRSKAVVIRQLQPMPAPTREHGAGE
jgi:hypothetical protein